MVYRGKPSSGCQTCRSRHIKCDETRPHCKNCARTGRECPGYPHPLDILLRDRVAFTRKPRSASPMTLSSVEVKAKDDSISATKVSKPTSSTLSLVPRTPQPPKPSVPARSFSPQIPDALYLPVEDTVTSLFFNSYIYLPKDPLVCMGFMELLPQFYATAPVGSHLRLSVLAVAFFSVAAWTHQDSLLRSSQQCFLKALSCTRQALEGDVDQSLDELLMTVLLLSVYEEFLAVKDKRAPSKAHVRGAVALINSCSSKCWSSPHSKTLAGAVQAQIIKTSTGAFSPLIQIPDVWPLSLPMRQLASAQLTMATTRVVNLRQRWMLFSAGNCAPNLDEAEVVLLQARYIDSQLVTWTYTLPEYWTPMPASSIPQSVQDAGVYQNRCDCYADFWITETWNWYRNSRLVVQDIILGCLRLLPNRADEVPSTIATIRSIAIDVCATVPFYLGDQTATVQMNTDRVEYPKTETRRMSPAHRQIAPLLGGWLILYPLQNLCSVDSLTQDQLDWIGGQLRRIHQIYTFEPGRSYT